ncbi:MAG: hypothetical protein RL693_2846, partial [Verrucomicrobiota bacterium]
MIFAACLPLRTGSKDHQTTQIASSLLQRLKWECDPDSPENNYDWTTNAQRTERTRAALLKDLNAIGPLSLHEVQIQRHHAIDAEYQVMLTL